MIADVRQDLRDAALAIGGQDHLDESTPVYAARLCVQRGGKRAGMLGLGVATLRCQDPRPLLVCGYPRVSVTDHLGQTKSLVRVSLGGDEITQLSTGWARKIRIAYEDQKGRPYWQEASTAMIVTHRTSDEARRQYEEQLPGP